MEKLCGTNPPVTTRTTGASFELMVHKKDAEQPTTHLQLPATVQSNDPQRFRLQSLLVA